MSIEFDYTAMLAASMGEASGIGSDELRSLEEPFRRIHRELTDHHCSGELPFWDLPFAVDMIEEVDDYAASAREGFEDCVVLGIGGSALGPIALHTALNHPQHNLLPKRSRKGCRFFCPDNVDPDLTGGVLDVVDPARTVFNVVSKSGGTSETIAQFLLVVDLLKRTLGNSWRDHLVVTTDPRQGYLRRFAAEEGIRAFAIDPGVGGRFSVLTPVGLLPAALTGVDVGDLCAGARGMREICFRDTLEDNPAAMFAGLLNLAQVKRRCPIHVFFAYSNRLYAIVDWLRQLWAESLGKRTTLDGHEVFTGPTPVKAVGATDQHSQVQLYVEGPHDKVVIFFGVKEFGREAGLPQSSGDAAETTYLQGNDLGDILNVERRATEYALTKAGRLNMTLEIERVDAGHVGALLYLLEAATLYGGGFYNVNPLDQPGVEAGKRATYAMLGRKGYVKQKEAIERHFADARQAMYITLNHTGD